ncbi:acetyl esterase/lipase [Flavobacterium sp. HSC-32F16]|uniref:alpha/beta hydrolase n=1 Tax=Flavobacterium sp. HSC-32F16 TaxID=2910964 RepID=UPI0020A24195|nr:alpha/beta hydrolase [Flavobacterium sp. HSC-32F16]MCP2029018.1 acetyl esterase/lipase [Flavobacterium sp. HSC-32F16]
MKIIYTFLAAGFLLLGTSVKAQEAIKLYQGKVPGSENWTQKEAQMYSDLFKTEVVYNVTDPSLLVYQVPKGVKNTGTAIVIAPGGGFQSLSINREGKELAEILSKKGITAFVLKYRLNKTETNDPAREMMDKLKDRAAFEKNSLATIQLAAQDGKNALNYVRNNASKYGIDIKKVGIIGFSAGSTVAMETVLDNKTEQLPDFVANIYGGPRPELLSVAAPEKKIPMFVCAASDDQLKLAPRSIQMYNKWLEAGQTVELHMYSKGGHGFGTGKQNLPVDSWETRFEDWLKLQGFLN